MRYFLNLLFFHYFNFKKNFTPLFEISCNEQVHFGLCMVECGNKFTFFMGNGEECTPKSSWWQSWWRKKLHARTGDNEIKGATLSLSVGLVICS